jgi:hypothetical protein
LENISAMPMQGSLTNPLKTASGDLLLPLKSSHNTDPEVAPKYCKGQQLLIKQEVTVMYTSWLVLQSKGQTLTDLLCNQ